MAAKSIQVIRESEFESTRAMREVSVAGSRGLLSRGGVVVVAGSSSLGQWCLFSVFCGAKEAEQGEKGKGGFVAEAFGDLGVGRGGGGVVAVEPRVAVDSEGMSR